MLFFVIEIKKEVASPIEDSYSESEVQSNSFGTFPRLSGMYRSWPAEINRSYTFIITSIKKSLTMAEKLKLQLGYILMICRWVEIQLSPINLAQYGTKDKSFWSWSESCTPYFHIWHTIDHKWPYSCNICNHRDIFLRFGEKLGHEGGNRSKAEYRNQS